MLDSGSGETAPCAPRAIASGTTVARAPLSRLESFAADVALLDIGLPGRDGYVVARLMRDRFPNSTFRLYAVTGYGREEDRERAFKAGFDGHLTKPVDPDRLLELVAAETSPGKSHQTPMRLAGNGARGSPLQSTDWPPAAGEITIACHRRPVSQCLQRSVSVMSSATRI
jgi:CheY-like chemotaxis protein